MAEDSQQILQRLMEEFANLQRQNETLREQMATLAGRASEAHTDLERRLGEHLEAKLNRTDSGSIGRTHIKPVRPHRFKGNGDGPRIQDWLHQAEQYVKAAGIETGEKGVWHITSFLESDAAIWWRLYSTQAADEEGKAEPKTKMPKEWNTLRTLMENTFREVNHDTDVRDRYIALRQTGTVAQYITRFRAAIVELPEETETSRIYWFLRGLKSEIQAQTRTHKPKTLMEAMDIADEADRASSRAYRGPRHGNFGPAKSIGGGSGPVPMQLGAIQTERVNAINRTDNMRLRQQNRCFLCRKVGHRQNQCPRLQWRKQSHGQGIDETRDDGRRKQANYRRKPVN